MRSSTTARAGAVIMAMALTLGTAAVAQAAPSPVSQQTMHAHHGQKVKISATGGADVRARPHGHARLVAHLGLGATVILAGPTLTVHGWLWLQLRGGGWICAHDVVPLSS